MVVGAKAMKARRFPPPWSAEVPPNYYVVRDANRQQLARTQSLIVARGVAGLSSLYVGARVAPVCDHSVAWGDSICGRRRRRCSGLLNDREPSA